MDAGQILVYKGRRKRTRILFLEPGCHCNILESWGYLLTPKCFFTGQISQGGASIPSAQAPGVHGVHTPECRAAPDPKGTSCPGSTLDAHRANGLGWWAWGLGSGHHLECAAPTLTFVFKWEKHRHSPNECAMNRTCV